MNPPIVCQGAPRDLGLDQGLAWQAAIRRAFGLSLRVGWRERWGAWLGRSGDPRVRALEQLVWRHFPHFAERTDGLAQAAALPRSVLLERWLRELRVPAEDAPRFAVEVGGASPRLVGGIGASAQGFGLRESRPESGYRSLELTRPWQVGAWAGVNQHGLCAALERHTRDPASGPEGVIPELLLQQCLERFDRVATSLEWCERRPSGGGGVLLFVDREGAVGAVELSGGGAARPPELPRKRPRGASAEALELRLLPEAPGLTWGRSGQPPARYTL